MFGAAKALLYVSPRSVKSDQSKNARRDLAVVAAAPPGSTHAAHGAVTPMHGRHAAICSLTAHAAPLLFSFEFPAAESPRAFECRPEGQKRLPMQ